MSKCMDQNEQLKDGLEHCETIYRPTSFCAPGARQLVGRPRQRYRMTGTDEVGWGRPYLDYLLCLAALSRHVETDRAPWGSAGASGR